MKLRYFQITVLLGICLSFLSWGCARARESRYLEDYHAMKDGRHLEKVMISPSLRLDQDTVIEIHKPTLETNESPTMANEAVDYLSGALYDELETVSGIKVLVAGAQASDHSGKRLVLETGITKLELGSRLWRFLAGEMGAGNTHVQVEGKLIDGGTHEVLLQFADRRAGSAYAGMDITGGDPQHLIESDLDGIANALAKTLSELPK